MKSIFFKVAGALGAIMIAAPAVADEAPPVKHVRHAERAPVAAAPAQAPSAQSNWTGSQIGGQGGASSMAQGFAEPGSHLYPYDCTPDPSYCMETPFSFNGITPARQEAHFWDTVPRWDTLWLA